MHAYIGKKWEIHNHNLQAKSTNHFTSESQIKQNINQVRATIDTIC